MSKAGAGIEDYRCRPAVRSVSSEGQRRKSAPVALERQDRGLADRKDNDRLMDSLPCPAPRPSRTRNDNYDADAILDALRDGKPYKAIASEHRVSRQLISKLAIQHGLRTRTVRSERRTTRANGWADSYGTPESGALVDGEWVRSGLVWHWRPIVRAVA